MKIFWNIFDKVDVVGRLVFFLLVIFNSSCGGGCGDEIGMGEIEKSDAGKVDASVVFEEMKPSAEQAARKHLVTPEGKMVRVVGLQHKNGSIVAQNVLGDTVEADSTDTKQGTCNVVIQAVPKNFKQDTLSEFSYVGILPDVGEALYNSVKRRSIPVMIPGSCVSGICLWTVMLRGDDCLKIADSDHYVGSTMKEFMAMSMKMKQRFLKTFGMCTSEEGEHRCTVPFGDKRAIQGEAIFFGGTSWAGRMDLDFYKFKNGQLTGG